MMACFGMNCGIDECLDQHLSRSANWALINAVCLCDHNFLFYMYYIVFTVNLGELMLTSC